MGDVEEGEHLEKRERQLELYKAAMSGDWVTAEGILDKYPEEFESTINAQGETALHIATAANHAEFVKQMVNKIPEEKKHYLAIKASNENNGQGNTAFFYAAVSGNVEVAQIMLKKNNSLAMIRGKKNALPIHVAALVGNKEMVRFLYKRCKEQLKTNDRKALLVPLIHSEIYDVALNMVENHLWLATAKDVNNETALHALATKLSSLTVIYTYISVSVLNIFRKKNIVVQKQGLELVKLLWKNVILMQDEDISRLMIAKSGKLIFIAAKQGNVEFLTTLIASYPDLVLKVNDNNYTIFHEAVLNRHIDIFKLIYEIGSIKNFINSNKDKEGNNILHLAAISVPSRLNDIPGPALQLQRELQWFEEVKAVVSPQQIEAKNKGGQTPRDMFIEKHQNLRKDGEDWMRNTANSCMVVATLITTVVFAAAFTVPGGNGQANGIPNLLNNIWFQIFAITDAISLIFSASSVLSFLSILTSRYSMDDFRISLPTKLIFGLFFLFIAIVTMMVAFVAAFFIIFKHGLLRFAFPIAGIAIFPILLFLFQHFLLFAQVIRSTYMSSRLFRRNENRLFSKRLVKNLNDTNKSS
ncbi:ankyrin repeat-containing protein ITN1 isoform X2 [Manihot esculenta]|uniref:ankyrin repeat-containing protein ITN1 isoform X2 n=1 Tax=Manihot esculenta TaxID=3983 RepID=UPI001CC73474|nr:ankyrin repeat-containing protein ITN1 isoform X2 [Manihot esculenta]